MIETGPLEFSSKVAALTESSADAQRRFDAVWNDSCYVEDTLMFYIVRWPPSARDMTYGTAAGALNFAYFMGVKLRDDQKAKLKQKIR